MISLTSPIDTPLHHWPAWVKLSTLCFGVVGVFFIQNPFIHFAFFTFILFLYAIFGRIFFITGISKLRPLWPFILLLIIWHLIDTNYERGFTIGLRMLSAVALANFVTMTTFLSDMMDFIHVITKPLRVLGVKTKTLEIAIALVVRIIPVLVIKAEMLKNAWHARSSRRASWRIIFPLTLNALDDSEYVAEALKARGGIF